MTMMSQPLMILGAPRSGTTFLCETLNQHPEIGLTNECRVFVQLKHMIEAQSGRPDLLGEAFRTLYQDFIRQTAGEWIERFYRQGLGIEARIWGDKLPSYADPTVLSGRQGSVPNLPESGSCLRLIREVLPAAKFIHIHRHPALVAHSLVRKGWIGSLHAGHEVWRQYVSEIADFFAELPEDRQLTVGHAELLTQPDQSAHRIADFLALSEAGPIRRFLNRQRRAPTPFSEPISDMSKSYRARARARIDDRALGRAAEWAERFGYAGADQRVA
jgi:LPS sulfotransferase NodH